MTRVVFLTLLIVGCFPLGCEVPDNENLRKAKLENDLLEVELNKQRSCTDIFEIEFHSCNASFASGAECVQYAQALAEICSKERAATCTQVMQALTPEAE